MVNDMEYTRTEWNNRYDVMHRRELLYSGQEYYFLIGGHIQSPQHYSGISRAKVLALEMKENQVPTVTFVRENPGILREEKTKITPKNPNGMC